MLVKYVKDKRGQRVGVVVAIAKDRIGWSKCNFSRGDKFNKEWGKMIAKKRAAKYVYTPIVVSQQQTKPNRNDDILIIEDEKDFCDVHNVANCVRKDLVVMAERASHYFKDKEDLDD